MSGWLGRLFGGRSTPSLPTIAADETGFSLTTGRHSRAVAWQSVRRVGAFKQDLGSHDQIVLLVEIAREEGEVISLPESCPGFAALFGPMEQVLGISPAWYLDIMTPAFAPTPVTLYLRPEDRSD